MFRHPIRAGVEQRYSLACRWQRPQFCVGTRLVRYVPYSGPLNGPWVVLWGARGAWTTRIKAGGSLRLCFVGLVALVSDPVRTVAYTDSISPPRSSFCSLSRSMPSPPPLTQPPNTGNRLHSQQGCHKLKLKCTTGVTHTGAEPMRMLM